jgi:hypothetical protein
MILSAVPLSLLAGPVPPTVERCSGPVLGPPGPDAGRAVHGRGGARFLKGAADLVPAHERELRPSGRAAERSEAAVSMGWSGRRVGHAAHDGGAGIHRPVCRRPIEGCGTWTYR